MESEWDHVTVIRKKAPTARTAKTEASLNSARRAGAVVASEKKSLSLLVRWNSFRFSCLQ